MSSTPCVASITGKSSRRRCQAAVDPVAKCCPECGQSLAAPTACRKCASFTSAGKFCPECGEPRQAH